MNTLAVGDLYSDAKGSGARFNGGKPAVELILWRPASRMMLPSSARDALFHLGWFQETHDVRCLFDLVAQLYGDDSRAAFIEAARVFEFGAKKYAAWNWAKGMPWSVPVACIARHLLAIDSGEENDPESRQPHRGHVVCNVLMLLCYQDTYREGNDLPTLFLPKEKPLTATELARHNGEAFERIAADFMAYGTAAARVEHVPLIEDGAYPNA